MDIAKARVLLAHSDPHEEARLRQALRPCRRVDACRDYPGLVRAMNERAYDLLIMPVAVCGADAETVRAEICARREISCPAMIVLLPNGLARAMRSFYNEGVVCLEGAPAEEKRLLETLGGLSEDDRLLPDWAGEEKVRAVLDRLSIPRTLKGYDLLLRASRLLARRPNAPSAARSRAPGSRAIWRRSIASSATRSTRQRASLRMQNFCHASWRRCEWRHD